MAGRGRAPPPPAFHRGGPPPFFEEPPPHMLPRPFGGPPPPPFAIQERLAAEIDEVQHLLADNQRLAATHVALKQEVAAAHHEIDRLSHRFATEQREADLRLHEFYEKSMKMEADARVLEGMKTELMQVHADIPKLNAEKQELTSQVHALSKDLAQASNDLQRIPALRAEVESMRQEIQHLRAGIEVEKKAYAESYEQGQVMEKNLVSMAREVEKLRAEVANVEKRARAALAASNQPSGYGGSYGNTEPNYVGAAYYAGYGVNQVPGVAEAGPQYGAAPGHLPWGGYDIQGTQGRR